jgi:hypothetical protein
MVESTAKSRRRTRPNSDDNTLSGLQLGLVNIIEKGGILPVFVLFNASFR